MTILLRSLEGERRPSVPAPGTRLYRVEAMGEDRAGIVAGLCRVLADRGVNIAELATRSRPGPGGSPHYELTILVEVAESIDARELRDALEAEADRLVIDVSLMPETPRLTALAPLFTTSSGLPMTLEEDLQEAVRESPHHVPLGLSDPDPRVPAPIQLVLRVVHVALRVEQRGYRKPERLPHLVDRDELGRIGEVIDEGGDHELRHARRAVAVQIVEAPEPFCRRRGPGQPPPGSRARRPGADPDRPARRALPERPCVRPGVAPLLRSLDEQHLRLFAPATQDHGHGRLSLLRCGDRTRLVRGEGSANLVERRHRGNDTVSPMQNPLALRSDARRILAGEARRLIGLLARQDKKAAS